MIKKISMILLSVAMVVVGVLHFLNPTPFVRIVPEGWPSPLMLVHISGVFEILGGIGLLVPRTRRFAAWGLIALFVAVFPANINMALNGIQLDPANPLPVWLMWARLPIQGVLVAWAWMFTTRGTTPPVDGVREYDRVA